MSAIQHFLQHSKLHSCDKHFTPDLLKTKQIKMTKKNANDSSLKYVRMTNDSEFSDLQWKTVEEPKIPYRSIVIACILLVMGTVLLTVGALLFTNTWFSVKYHDRTWPVIVVGSILFIPGFYHVRLAYYAYKGYKGYKFEDIPDYDDE